MLINSILVDRYAKGLFFYVNELGKSHLIYKEMKIISSLINDVKYLKFFLNNPIIGYKKKMKIVKKVLFFLSKYFLNFLNLLLYHKRENLLYLISIKYRFIFNKYNNIIKIKVKSSFPISEIIKNIIIKKMSFFLGINKKYKLNNIIVPNLGAGFLIIFGDRQWDFTINSLLMQFHKSLSI